MPSSLETAPSVEADVVDEVTLRDDDASHDAILAVFRWVIDNDEGIPPEGSYRDPWLRSISEHSDSADSAYGDDCVSESANKKSDWTE